jgi:hypothetical protein
MAAEQQAEDERLVSGEPNEALVIELALEHMAIRGWIEEADDELVERLRRLYHANPVCQIEVKFTGELLHDALATRPGEYLAAAYEQECIEHYERHEAPRMTCPCGMTFGIYQFGPRHAHFFTLTDDGLFDQQLNDCPSCARKLAKTREETANGQLGLGF